MGKQSEQHTVQIRLVCIDPPPSLEQGAPAPFGLQDKAQGVHPGLAQADGSLVFECEVRVQRRQGSAPPDFAGSFVHGPRGDRFLYLSWQREDGSWIKRLKIPLAGITWAQIGLAEQRDARLSATVAGSGAARTEPLGDGWTVDAA